MKEKTQKVRTVNYKPILLVFLILFFVGIMVLLQTKSFHINQTGTPVIGKGVPAPNFTLPDLDGNNVSLADYRGKVVLLNIWATWCKPCVEEMPSLEKLHQEFKNEDFVMLAVSIDEAGAGVVRPFMKEHRLSFSALTDIAKVTKNLFQLTGVPESFIVDREGIIVERVIGPRNWASPGAINYFRELIQSN